MTLIEFLKMVADSDGKEAKVAASILNEMKNKPMTPERAREWARQVIPDHPSAICCRRTGEPIAAKLDGGWCRCKSLEDCCLPPRQQQDAT